MKNEYMCMKESKNDYKIKHIEKPSGITNSPSNMIPYLPDKELFFDSRHWTYGLADGILPFSLTTRISANNQQFLKVSMKESKKRVTMAERMHTLIDKGQINKEGQCIDLYNVITHDDVFCFVTTRVDASIYYVTQKSNETNMEKQNAINLPPELEGKKFRIRKLTPRECFRLMGVDDKDIDKIQAAGVSNSGQYKLAGNSIVVDVLYHIFRKMFIETDVDKNQEPQQLTLF